MTTQDLESFEQVRTYSKKIRKELLNFNSEHISSAGNSYVGWVDLMGAGHAMSTSTQKTANFLARLHMAVERSRLDTKFDGRLLVVNDGVFVVAKTKHSLISMMGRIFILLAANFIATPRPHDRFLVRGGISYGPVYFGDQLRDGVSPKKFRDAIDILDTVMFGSAIIQAYKAESIAPPYGVAVHESARAFSQEGSSPFLTMYWPWWAPNETVDYPNAAPLTKLKDCLLFDLKRHFQWIDSTLIYHGLDRQKIEQWSRSCAEYFRIA
ncbi:hypothetical protein [Burkholderia pyrrocinia]|uniref:hypothetical protein n=1 Tax=Burkholderia pyrrocinia TaxID=60550 RepID=UPI001049D1D7|nr:hypothetical protein [Burkholderia pyrrocinia]TDA44288.1 hypothetical protein EVG18_28170 [Burkholderia pyrrocinia]